MTNYQCKFLFCGEERTVSSERGISIFADGFWINERMDFTQENDARYWIPPSAILHIIKYKD
jgi:hypothetical protein